MNISIDTARKVHNRLERYAKKHNVRIVAYLIHDDEEFPQHKFSDYSCVDPAKTAMVVIPGYVERRESK